MYEIMQFFKYKNYFTFKTIIFVALKKQFKDIILIQSIIKTYKPINFLALKS